MSYEWSDYKRKYYLDGKEIFVESYTISSNEKESIHEIFTVKDRETGISRNKKGKLYDKSKGDPYPCRSCFYEDNSKDDNTCGTCHTYSNNGELFRTWRPKEKWEAKLK